ncbi:hypothetical protein BJF85_05585 [Saccharomonospora sp. CUA-673]|uniref:hypothetical protein n=1 Tax=Saccharomonospora sp. CUA-673 TaxID=1904969 RepID=UPI000964924F|nr:hypothetical protein [Saccharomonospora sp. CUA-673]OLT40619.1 hypothetical protein BJF85_05585 [Saccharomonospora sp. CUA-673]
MSGYDVDSATLVGAGDEFVEVADAAREAAVEFRRAADEHHDSIDGFAAAATSASVGLRWEHHITDLCKRTAVFGGFLHQGAADYEGMEQSVLDTLPGLAPDGDA